MKITFYFLFITFRFTVNSGNFLFWKQNFEKEHKRMLILNVVCESVIFFLQILNRKCALKIFLQMSQWWIFYLIEFF